MAARPALAVLILGALSLGCGGQSARDEGTGGTGGLGASGGSGGAGAQAGLGGTAGAGALGGSGGSAGTSTTPEECPPEPSSCVPSCASESFPTAPTCENARWACPPPSVPLTSCPAESCARDRGYCCNPTTGQAIHTECGADGLRVPCPDGAEPQTEPYLGCYPEAEGVSSCLDLEGRACPSDEYQCHDPGRCSGRCTCGPNEEGRLVFQCGVLLC